MNTANIRTFTEMFAGVRALDDRPLASRARPEPSECRAYAVISEGCLFQKG
jgi:hypothetical protein